MYRMRETKKGEARVGGVLVCEEIKGGSNGKIEVMGFLKRGMSLFYWVAN